MLSKRGDDARNGLEYWASSFLDGCVLVVIKRNEGVYIYIRRELVIQCNDDVSSVSSSKNPRYWSTPQVVGPQTCPANTRVAHPMLTARHYRR